MELLKAEYEICHPCLVCKLCVMTQVKWRTIKKGKSNPACAFSHS